MKILFKSLYKAINIPRHISNHIFGIEHSQRHRMLSGALIMMVGILIAKIEIEERALYYLVDGTGYLLHGIGSFPYIEYFRQINDE